MLYFQRVKNLSKAFFGISGLFIFLLVISYMNPSEIRNTNLYPLALIIFSIVSLSLGIALKYVVKDAREYIERELNAGE
ncbi:hypothetical protein [Jeotgalibacillus salarius]|uniref:Uncharacterized protein n=1 Tax=Jeotgalibacillus salarius TaxID=546023 RepID=A0A4Y8LEE6_9BACL|nr:hypothetical protein [Jeotgalibacillus salarius]TFE00559.1 hypothetical protein E2626_11325 [Jeotgalibacillus salarius]